MTVNQLFKRLFGQSRNGGAAALHPCGPAFMVPRGSRLHLACGNRVIPGWVNLDLFRPPAGTIPFNVTQYPWPIESESVAVVYSEDLFEHLAQQDQIRYLAETARVLMKGGIVRIVAPDLAHSLAHRILSNEGVNLAAEYYDVPHGHVVLPTVGYLRDILPAFGFGKVSFCIKNESEIEDFPGDSRPNPLSNDGRPEEGQVYVEATRI